MQVREVARRFDRITYLKAAAVLRMVERTVGERMFRDGLRSFLRAHAYRNARSADLLRALRFAICLSILHLVRKLETRPI